MNIILPKTGAGIAFAVFFFASLSLGLRAQTGSGAQPYKVIQTATIGGEGGFDYVYADITNRSLYIPRMGAAGRITIYDLDTLKPKTQLPHINAHGVAVDPVSQHAFSSSRPVIMWDAKTFQILKQISVEGQPDGIFCDPFNARIWIFSHRAPNATVIDAQNGTVVGTLDLGGEPEQAVSDRNGHLYIDLEDKNQIAVVDAKALKVTGVYDLASKAGGPAGLAFDLKNRVLFATCREPATMVALNADNGKILASFPIGQGSDGALFNSETHEAFSSNGRDGTLSIVSETSPTEISLEQTLSTQSGARTSTLDTKTGRIFLVSAKFGPPAQPAAPGGWSRPPMLPGSFSILVVGR